MPQAAIALGTNLPAPGGNREENLYAAIEHVRRLGEVTAVSSFHDTAPELLLDQPRFLNAALLLQTSLSPIELLHALLAIEQQMGRVRTGVPPKGPRLIDLDLIFYGDLQLATPELTLPHPAMQDRAFVLQPLREIAPEWIHPRLGRPVKLL